MGYQFIMGLYPWLPMVGYRFIILRNVSMITNGNWIGYRFIMIGLASKITKDSRIGYQSSMLWFVVR